MIEEQKQNDVSVNAIANVRLPSFWKQSPDFWFIHAESVFANHRLTADSTRVNFVIGALDEDGVRTIGDLLGPTASYDAIRSRLIDAYSLPKSVRFREIVKPGGMGDRRPSQLLRDMRSVMPAGIGEEALKEFWLQKLPSNVMAIIASLDAPLDSLASRADRVMEASSPQSVDAFSKDQMADLASAVSALSQQVQSLTKIVNSSKDVPRQRQHSSTQWAAQQPTQACYYHEKYGNGARNCRPPCNFKPKAQDHVTSAPAEN
ncbi:uncharacterized protein LOC126847777 [Adelges cooleyi]|uniref:uncharacterized protein LOC126845299 n=1 Tax=Adelges cooleyi TaxID=133065 RepID=UPI00217F48C0|nr:uncharacterized protein LOC126845299 [Adelges cooleyi]XP_050444134.1 uncharacterized protein LOC126847777 [Adelges cooleyi]